MKEWNPKVVVAIKAAVLLIIALLSMFVVSKWAVSTETHAETIASLDEKRTTVMELTGASTAASAGITMIPGDIGTPIADKLADLTSCFLLVICAIYLEKYLVTIVGYATFVILIPGACLLMIADMFVKHDGCRKLAVKLALFGIAIYIVIPTSVKVSNLIETTYQSSIEATIESAKDSAESLDETEGAAEEETEQGFLGGIISGVQDSVSAATEEVENVLNNFIEALAVMIVTSCVIPVLVLFFFVWLVKILLGVEIPLPKKRIERRIGHRDSCDREEEYGLPDKKER